VTAQRSAVAIAVSPLEKRIILRALKHETPGTTSERDAISNVEEMLRNAIPVVATYDARRD
jgi:hypothetical protein